MQDVLGFAQSMLHMALSNALFAGVAALLVWSFSRLCRKPALIHALWLVVLLKLLTPPIWNLPIHLAIHSKAHAQMATVAVATKTVAVPSSELPKPAAVEIDGSMPPLVGEVPEKIEASARDLSFLFERSPGTESPVELKSSSRVIPVMPAPTPRRWMPHIDWAQRVNWARLMPAGAALWAMGTFVCLVLAALRIARFHRILRLAARADWELQEEADRLARRMGLNASPRIWLVSGAVCPMLWAAWGRPRVLVPRELWGRFDAQQRRTLLVHELAHCVRRDHWVRYLELLATAIYWWNPLCWWARRHLREAEEQCCDAWVMALMPGSFKQYAHALLEAVDWISAPLGGGSRPYSVPALASGMGQFTDLKRRLTMLKQGNVSQSVGFGGAAATLALAASLLPVMPTFAQTAAPPAASAPKPQFIDVTAPEQTPASALPGGMPGPMVATSSAAGPSIVGVTPATTPPADPNAAAEYQLAVAGVAGNQAWAKIQDGKQVELAEVQAEVAALQAQLSAATARLQKLRMEALGTDAMNGNKNNPNALVWGYLPDGNGGVIVVTPDKKIVARIQGQIAGPKAPIAPNPFQWQPGIPMPPMTKFGGGGMPAMPGGGGISEFGAGFGRAGAQFKADAAREERMKRIESQLSELMKSVAALRQEIQPATRPPSSDQAPRSY